ncbi:hypothetical protein ACH5RR_030139 [Cinchona calisaya]|uniref:Wall-associated receptor kinase C-terminal domain-containing protein n=1 Tax=Cinchona calisaya TaxID=153742 RepID=A0ABD2YYY6_9GENT
MTENAEYSIFSTPRLHLLSNCTSMLPEILSRYQVRYCDGVGLGLAIFEDDEDLSTAMRLCEINVLAPAEIDRDEKGNGAIDYERLLRRGFIFNWTASDCRKCEKSGGRCGFNSSSYHFSCFCRDRVHFVRCPKSHRRNLVVIIAIGVSAPVLVIMVVLLFLFKRKYSFNFWKEDQENHETVEAMLKNQEFLAPK